MARRRAIVDCETTGLDDRLHFAYELCIWRDDWDDPFTIKLPHTLDHAEPRALEIGDYWGRGFYPFDPTRATPQHVATIADMLRDCTLVGANPRFDAAMIRKFLGFEPWHHRLINVEDHAMALFGFEEPPGFGAVAAELATLGYEVPTPDHTAEGDVRATRAVWTSLLDFRKRLRSGADVR